MMGQEDTGADVKAVQLHVLGSPCDIVYARQSCVPAAPLKGIATSS